MDRSNLNSFLWLHFLIWIRRITWLKFYIHPVGRTCHSLSSSSSIHHWQLRLKYFPWVVSYSWLGFSNVLSIHFVWLCRFTRNWKPFHKLIIHLSQHRFFGFGYSFLSAFWLHLLIEITFLLAYKLGCARLSSGHPYNSPFIFQSWHLLRQHCLNCNICFFSIFDSRITFCYFHFT